MQVASIQEYTNCTSPCTLPRTFLLGFQLRDRGIVRSYYMAAVCDWFQTISYKGLSEDRW